MHKGTTADPLETLDTHAHRKPKLYDVGIRFDPRSARTLAEGWRELGLKVRVYSRDVKADGVRFPLYMIVGRSAAALLLAALLPLVALAAPPRFEDEPGWDCRTMGNRLCGPVVNVNAATGAEIGFLPYVGEATAEKVIKARPFKTREEFCRKVKAPGFSVEKCGAALAHVRITGPTTAREEIPTGTRTAPRDITAFDEEGRIVFVCATKARRYVKDGRATYEVDHYLRDIPCPAEPIP